MRCQLLIPILQYSRPREKSACHTNNMILTIEEPIDFMITSIFSSQISNIHIETMKFRLKFHYSLGPLKCVDDLHTTSFMAKLTCIKSCFKRSYAKYINPLYDICFRDMPSSEITHHFYKRIL